MSIQKQKLYPINRQIKINMILNNSLNFDLLMKNIHLTSATEEIEMSSNFINLYDHIQDSDVCTLMKGSEFIIPITLKCKNQISGNIGKASLVWTDQGLSEYNTTLSNHFEIILPHLDCKKFDVNLEYKIPTSIQNKDSVIFKVILTNMSEEFKKVVFLVDNSSHFVSSGVFKKKFVLYPDDSKEIEVALLPLSYGKLKLPPFKIMEFPLASNSYDNKICSIYYLSEYLQVNG
jgi:hypothetical protein